MTTQKPDFHLPVTIESQAGEREGKKGIIFKNVPCQIFLPKVAYGDVKAYLELSDGQAEVIGIFGKYFWRMSIKGWLRWGGTLINIEANKCYIPNGGWPSRRYGSSFDRITLGLEVIDLKVTEVHEVGDAGIVNRGFGKGFTVKKPSSLPIIAKPDKPAHVTFWLTDNHDLRTFRFETMHHNGSLEVDSGDPHTFNLLPEIDVTFDRQFSWSSDNKLGRTERIESLVAYSLLPAKGNQPIVVDAVVLRALDDFLLLSSFASRWGTICLGWNIAQWPYLIKQYRHGRALPYHLTELRRPIEQDRENGLIDIAEFPDFLRHVWPLWTALDVNSQETLRQVLHTIVHSHSLDQQSAFVSLYGVLEMLVLHFRRNNDLEFVLSNEDEWNQFRSDLKDFITKHPLLAGSASTQKAKRRKAHEKISEFNRVAFGTAFNAFCEQTPQAIPHDDLWPVNGKNSLSWIRNRIVHGEVQGREQSNALFFAHSHIECLVERCVLCLFSWPIKDSRVRPGYLTHLTAHNKEKWEHARDVLFGESNSDS